MNDKNRSEDLLTCDRHVVGHVEEQRWANEIAVESLRTPKPADGDRCTVLNAADEVLPLLTVKLLVKSYGVAD
jgi:hypothetical protein